MNRSVTLTTIAAAAILALAGCAAQPSYETSGVPDIAAPQVAIDSGEVSPAVEGVTTDASQVSPVLEPQVITTGSLSVVVDVPVAAADEAVEIATQAGGHASNRAESAATAYQPEYASVTLRIPGDALDSVLDELRGLGDVVSMDLYQEDVTLQLTDLDVRIATLQASIERLQGLLATASDTATLLDVEAQLTSRTAELESLLAQQTWLQDQVALSTITVTFTTAEVVDPAEPTNFFEAIAQGWTAFVAALGGLLIWVGLSWPWLLLLAGLIWLIVWLIRRARARRAARPSVAAPSATQPAARVANPVASATAPSSPAAEASGPTGSDRDEPTP